MTVDRRPHTVAKLVEINPISSISVTSQIITQNNQSHFKFLFVQTIGISGLQGSPVQETGYLIKFPFQRRVFDSLRSYRRCVADRTGGHCTNNRIGPFLNDVNLIDCSFLTTNEKDVILGRFYVGPILPLVQRPPYLRFSHLNVPFFQNSEFIWNVVPVGKQ